MARMATPLDTGDPMPELMVDTVAHGRVDVPGVFGSRWGVLLLYHGHWCAYCARQLAAFQQGMPELEYAGIGVVAASTDTERGARRLAEITGATFPIGYGLAPIATASRLGAYYDEERGTLHATGFVVRPDATIGVACYSSGNIGRLAWEDVVRLVAFWERKI
ncbi:MAG: redoxin domain-containing protein [Myxococcales bacterium]|nr:redoxin domain-containing protein [Myxococcales bacterium]